MSPPRVGSRGTACSFSSGDHYPCTQPVCLEKKFVVFPTDMDLRVHMVTEVSSAAVGVDIVRGDADPSSMARTCRPGIRRRPDRCLWTSSQGSLAHPARAGGAGVIHMAAVSPLADQLAHPPCVPTATGHSISRSRSRLSCRMLKPPNESVSSGRIVRRRRVAEGERSTQV